MREISDIRRAWVTTWVVCLALLLGGGCKSGWTQRDAKSAELRTKLNGVLHQLDSTGAVFSARVVDPATGRELYAENATMAVTPASNMKLLATAAAVDRWPADHTFKTYLALDGKDLWIIGTGDPGIGDPGINRKRSGSTVTVLHQWADALKARGVSAIDGNLYYYDGAFELQQIHPGWNRGDLVNWYAAPISGLNFNDNCIDVTISPTKPGEPVTYEVTPPVANITIVNNCTTGDRDTADWERAPDQNVYTITGTCSKRTELKSKPVTDPGAFFCDALRTELRSKRIEVKGAIMRATSPLGGKLVPPSDKLVATHESRLDELLPRINKNSQNMVAEGLCKLLAMEHDKERGIDRPASWKGADEAVRAFLKKHKIDDSPLVYADGSGLARANKVTARMISDILLAMNNHPRHELFFDSLSVGGKDGTISNRFTDAVGRVHAKTGYISGVRSLSGFVQAQGGDWLIFSIIYNKFRGTVRPYEHMQDEAARLLMSYPALDYKPATTRPATTTAASE